MATHPLPANLFETLVEAAAAGRALATLTVLRATGSTPRKAGTRAIVDAAGNLWGTIGGGLLENEARSRAVDAIRTGEPATYDFRFTGTSAAANDPVCGGAMRILIDPRPALHQPAYARAAEAMRRRQRGNLRTTLTAGRTITAEWSDEPGSADGYFASPDADGAPESLVETIIPTPLLLISGGGHVGQALARQAVLVGFDVVVADDRAEFADPALFPAGVLARAAGLPAVLAEFPPTPDTYIALVGRGHRVDADALAACIASPAAYIGMMGSRRKVTLLRRDFVTTGRCTDDQFARVHAPIGLDLGAETVPEIAAAIVAQLIIARRGRGTSATKTNTPAPTARRLV